MRTARSGSLRHSTLRGGNRILDRTWDRKQANVVCEGEIRTNVLRPSHRRVERALIQSWEIRHQSGFREVKIGVEKPTGPDVRRSWPQTLLGAAEESGQLTGRPVGFVFHHVMARCRMLDEARVGSELQVALYALAFDDRVALAAQD